MPTKNFLISSAPSCTLGRYPSTSSAFQILTGSTSSGYVYIDGGTSEVMAEGSVTFGLDKSNIVSQIGEGSRIDRITFLFQFFAVDNPKHYLSEISISRSGVLLGTTETNTETLQGQWLQGSISTMTLNAESLSSTFTLRLGTHSRNQFRISALNIQVEYSLPTIPVISGLNMSVGSDGIISSDKSLGAREINLSCYGSATIPYGPYEYQYSYYYTGGSWVNGPWQSSSSITYDISTQRGKTWYFRVKMRNLVGESSWSNTATILSNTLPTVPNSFSTNKMYIYDNVISLTWGTSTDLNSQVSYKVLVSKNDGSYQEIASGINTEYYSYDISNDSVGTKYKFKLRCVDNLNEYVEKDTTSYNYKCAEPTVTLKNNGNAIVEGTASVTATCSGDYYPTDVSYEFSYDNGNGTWTADSFTSTNSFSKDITLYRGNTWRFRVRVKTSGGTSTTYSNIVNINSNTLPSKVTSISSSQLTIIDDINLYWNECKDSDGLTIKYIVYYKKSSQSSWTKYSTFTNTTSANINLVSLGVNNGESIKFKIETKDGFDVGYTDDIYESNYFIREGYDFIRNTPLGHVVVYKSNTKYNLPIYNKSHLDKPIVGIYTTKCGNCYFAITDITNPYASPIRIKTKSGVQAIVTSNNFKK